MFFHKTEARREEEEVKRASDVRREILYDNREIKEGDLIFVNVAH